MDQGKIDILFLSLVNLVDNLIFVRQSHFTLFFALHYPTQHLLSRRPRELVV